MNRVPMLQTEVNSRKKKWELSSKIKLFNTESQKLSNPLIWNSSKYTLEGEEGYVEQRPTSHCVAGDKLYLGLNTGQIVEISINKPSDMITQSRLNLSEKEKIWNKYGSKADFQKRRDSLKYALDCYEENPSFYETQKKHFEEGEKPWHRLVSLDSIINKQLGITSLFSTQDGTVIDGSKFGVFDTKNNIQLSPNYTLHVDELDGELVHVPLYESFSDLLKDRRVKTHPNWGELLSLEGRVILPKAMRADVSGPGGMGKLCINNGMAYLKGGNGYEHIQVTDLSNGNKRKIDVGSSSYFVKHGRQVFDVRNIEKNKFGLFPSTSSHKEKPIYESDSYFTTDSTVSDLLVAQENGDSTLVKSLDSGVETEIKGNWKFMLK
jgi:hypothetical protein